MDRKLIFRISVWLIFLCAFTFLFSTSAYAAGEGDGGGGGPSIPLLMDWSFPANGETGVPVNTIIQCKFSHNVANFDVAPRNAGKFSLTKEDGTPVDAEVYQVDAQMEFDKRQYVYLYPKNELEEYTTYIVKAQEGVQAKNGMVTEQDQTFRFTTGSRTTAHIAVAAWQMPTKPASGTKAAQQTAQATVTTSGAEANTSTEPPMQEQPPSWIMPALLTAMGILLIGSFCLAWYKRRGDSSN